MSHDINMLRAKLRKALDNIGKNNGHACPPTTSNHDPILHELYISAECQAYFKTRHDAAKTEALGLSDTLDDAVQGVIDMDAGTSVTLVSGELYTMTADISKPAARLDQRALRNYLQTTLGLDAATVNKAFEACTSKNSPAKKIKVSAM